MEKKKKKIDFGNTFCLYFREEVLLKDINFVLQGTGFVSTVVIDVIWCRSEAVRPASARCWTWCVGLSTSLLTRRRHHWCFSSPRNTFPCVYRSWCELRAAVSAPGSRQSPLLVECHRARHQTSTDQHSSRA